VLVDGSGKLPPDARLLSEPGHTLVATSRADAVSRRRISQAGADVESIPAGDGAVDLAALLRTLARRDVTSVLVEGGGALLGSLFDLGLVDKVVAFIAPVIVGGAAAPSPVAGRGVKRIADAMVLHRVRMERFGRDMALIGYCEMQPDVHRDS
jgi:diaminohydroxyphosphoribosylaminopyrimidine deaminase/5-amino-6-(5-phosphoribosylamino)uracil reductase